MYHSYHRVRSCERVIIFLLFLLAVVAPIVTAQNRPLESQQQTYCLRLPFVHKLTSVPTPLEKHVSPSCEGTTFLLLDKRFRAYFFEKPNVKQLEEPWQNINRGGGFGLSNLVPAGYNPFGYKLTELGERFLQFEGSLDSDVGRFLNEKTLRCHQVAVVGSFACQQERSIHENLQELARADRLLSGNWIFGLIREIQQEMKFRIEMSY